MRIYIPSRARYDTDLLTWQRLSPELRELCVLVVPFYEVDRYATRHESSHLVRDREYGNARRIQIPKRQIVSCEKEGIGPTRQWILERHDVKRHSPLMLMLDDDLTFFERYGPGLDHFRRASHASQRTMIDRIRMNSYVHGGVSPREGANRNTAEYNYNNRNLRALFYDAPTLRTRKVRFDRVPVMEDFDAALQLLRLGYESKQFNWWVHNQPGSNTRGGCSEYRTAAVQAKGAHGLSRLHPDFVKVVDKPPPISGTWGGEPRVDVQIAWKRAWESSQ